MELLTIAGREVGDGRPPYVIAELGANHNGDMELCARLIDAAQEAGADAVKFQSWTRQSLISSAEYDRDTRYAADRQAPSLADAVERYQMTPEPHGRSGRPLPVARHGLVRQLLFGGRGRPARITGCARVQDRVDGCRIICRCCAISAPPASRCCCSTGMATLGEVELRPRHAA